jgi:hypothetical protein
VSGKSLLLIKPFHAKGILTNKMFKGILADILIKKNVSQFFPGWEKIKQRRISFVLDYLRMML